VRIGRNVKVAADVRSSDYTGRVVRSGESVEVRRPKRVTREITTAVAPAKPDSDAVVVGAVVNAASGRGKRVVNDD
jgi:hypothetical protein